MIHTYKWIKFNSFYHCYVSLTNQLICSYTLFKQFYFKQFSLTWSICLNTVEIWKSSTWPTDKIVSEWTWEWLQWRGIPHSPKLQYHWNLTSRLSSFLSWTLVGGVLPLWREAVGVLSCPFLGVKRCACSWLKGIYTFSPKCAHEMES